MPEEPMLVFGPYPDVPMSLQSSWLRVDWYNAGEGWWGDYNPGNPEDENLLRFDVYVRRGPQRQEDMDDGWQEVEDASYCTRIPVNCDSGATANGRWIMALATAGIAVQSIWRS